MIKSLIEDLYLSDFAPVSPGADLALARFKRELDFQIVEIPSGLEKNGWLVPDSWEYLKAEIRIQGKVVYDGRKHPLGVVGYSKSFNGKVSLKELKQHLYFSEENPEAIVFHCTHFFRPAERDWGFCLPKTIYDSLKEGEYEVELITKSLPGTMKILEYTLAGKSEETLLLHAHNCHPGQANDDLSGVAVGIEFMRRLQKMKDRRYTYTLVVSPELFGSFYWLDSLSEERAKKILGAIMLKSVGNESPLKLQLSYSGKTMLDLAARNALRNLNPQFVEGPFRRVYGNDETIFEAPGYEIPSISLTRYPFPQYHTSLDTPAIVSEARLEETVQILEKIAYAFQGNCRMQRHFKGQLALSHPRYNLYKPFWNPSEKGSPPRSEPNHWHYLMIDMFRDFDGQITLLELAERHQLPFDEVHAYLSKLVQAGAIEFTPVDAPSENVLAFKKGRHKHAP